jgi:hypothetical protein
MIRTRIRERFLQKHLDANVYHEQEQFSRNFLGSLVKKNFS